MHLQIYRGMQIVIRLSDGYEDFVALQLIIIRNVNC